MEHHAYLYVAASIAAASLPEEVERNTTDTERVIFAQLGVNEARELARRASLTAVSDARRQFVIFTPAITLEAQNALLKLFEDPPRGVVFHLILPNPQALLPTLRSRFADMQSQPEAVVPEAFVSFQQASYADRLGLIAERQKAKDTQWQQLIYQGMVTTLSKSDSALVVDRFVAQLFIEAFPRRGAAKKMLLEQLALALPVA